MEKKSTAHFLPDFFMLGALAAEPDFLVLCEVEALVFDGLALVEELCCGIPPDIRTLNMVSSRVNKFWVCEGYDGGIIGENMCAPH